MYYYTSSSSGTATCYWDIKYWPADDADDTVVDLQLESAPVAKLKPHETDMEWLDRRVEEMRIRL